MRPYPVSAADRFSLVEGSLLFRLQVWLTALIPQPTRVAARALIAVAIAWLPLLLLPHILGDVATAYRGIPLVWDFATNARLLIALPLLIAGEAAIDPQLRSAARHFVSSNLVTPDALPAFEEIIRKTRPLYDSPWTTVVLVLMAFESVILGTPSEHLVGRFPEFAGPTRLWFQWVSLPLFRLVVFRWLWLLVVWAIFLRRVSGLPLYCVATHPDHAGGLGFLNFTQLFFGLLPFAISTTVAGGVANMLAYEGVTLGSKKFLLAGCCVLGVMLAAAPLLVMTRTLWAVKKRDLWRYASLGALYAQGFDEKWLQGAGAESKDLLGAADIQSLADLASSFAVVREMRMILISKELVIWLTLAAALPMLVLLIAATPADDIFRSIVDIVT